MAAVEYEVSQPLGAMEPLVEAEHPQTKLQDQMKSLLRKNGWVTLSLLVLVIIVVLAMSVIARASVHLTGDTCNDSELQVPAAQDAQVVNSRVYQIKLANIREWQSRDTKTRIWERAVTESSAYLDLSNFFPYQTVRNQYKLDYSPCMPTRSALKFRVSDRIMGADYSVAITIKDDGHSQEEARNYPYWPSSETFAEYRTSQKCENNVHYCNEKYSRETKVIFEEPKSFTTCADLIRLYPWAFPQLNNDDLFLPIASQETEYWWLAQYSGVLNSTTKFEIEITLKYRSFENALGGLKPIDGEWSIRIFTLNEGLSEEYDLNVVADIENLWRSLSTLFGNDEIAGCSTA